MKTKLLKKVGVAGIIPVLVFAAVATYGSVVAPAHAQDGNQNNSPTCSTITLKSGTNTQTAGFTETDPASAPASLAVGAYSNGDFGDAVVVQTATSSNSSSTSWLEPGTDANFSGSGAAWISTDATWPGAEGNDEGSAAHNQWRLFQDTFTLPAGATVSSSQLYFAADNAAQVYLNGNSIATTNNVYGAAPESGADNFASATVASFTPVEGVNTLDFVVRNWANTSDTNPTGLIYKVVVNYCVSSSGSGSGALHVDGIDSENATSTANGSFENGWRYVFHLTVPTDETNLAMKFSDWKNDANGDETIPVGDNIRIFSDQDANSGNQPVTLSATDTYSSPALVLSGDLDPNTPGRQVDLVVEVRIPAHTANGSYTASYGIQTLPPGNASTTTSTATST